MFIDASAIVAILKREPEATAMIAALKAADKTFCSQIARWEAVVSLAVQASRKRGFQTMTPDDLEAAEVAVHELLHEIGAKDVLLGDTIGKIARETAGRYGKIAGHPAQLNMGDCFAYAAAKNYRVPLLYKGDDFSKTDLA